MRITLRPANFIKRFNTLPGRLKSGISDGIKKTALMIEAESKRGAPVDTGRMRASIYTTISSTMAIVQPKVDYAIYVHEGTSKMKARPFMANALDKVKKNSNSIFRAEIKKTLNF